MRDLHRRLGCVIHGGWPGCGGLGKRSLTSTSVTHCVCYAAAAAYAARIDTKTLCKTLSKSLLYIRGHRRSLLRTDSPPAGRYYIIRSSSSSISRRQLLSRSYLHLFPTLFFTHSLTPDPTQLDSTRLDPTRVRPVLTIPSKTRAVKTCMSCGCHPTAPRNTDHKQ